MQWGVTRSGHAPLLCPDPSTLLPEAPAEAVPARVRRSFVPCWAACRIADERRTPVPLHSRHPRADVRFHPRKGFTDRPIPVAGGGKWSRVERSGRPSEGLPARADEGGPRTAPAALTQ